LLEQLRTIRSSAVKEVRGRGLWIGIELHKQARLYCEALKEQGILCKETHDRSSASLLPWYARGDRPGLRPHPQGPDLIRAGKIVLYWPTFRPVLVFRFPL